MELTKMQKIDAIVDTYQTDAVTKENARSYLWSLSDTEVGERYENRVEFALSPTEQAKLQATRGRELVRIYKHSNLRADAEAQIVNDAKLEQYFPVGLSLENFYSLISQNPQLASQFLWSGEPFGEERARQREHVGQNEANFREACKSLAISGTANVAPTMANWSLIRSQLGEEWPSLAKILNVLTNGSITGFSPNSPAQVAAWSNEAETQERQQLCRVIADASAYDQPARDENFRRLYNSLYTTLSNLRAKAEDIQNRKQFAHMSAPEIKAYLARERAGLPQPEPRTLPAGIDKKAIYAADAEQMRKWQSIYGSELLNARLQGLS